MVTPLAESNVKKIGRFIKIETYLKSSKIFFIFCFKYIRGFMFTKPNPSNKEVVNSIRNKVE
jgi:hypothetical protein